MSFEEEKMDLALKALEETEKRCEVSDGFVKSIKKKFSKKKREKVYCWYLHCFEWLCTWTEPCVDLVVAYF